MDCASVRLDSYCEYSAAEQTAMKALTDVVWPSLPGSVPPEMTPEEERPSRIVATVWGGAGRLTALSESFARRIVPPGSDRETDVLALASVCVPPDCRGRGMGEAVVRAQFARVDRGEFPVALWQTSVPDFYRKLGARVVENRFRNGLHPSDPEKSPFWDKFAMVYPVDVFWPDGVVDLKGFGF